MLIDCSRRSALVILTHIHTHTERERGMKTIGIGTGDAKRKRGIKGGRDQKEDRAPLFDRFRSSKYTEREREKEKRECVY